MFYSQNLKELRQYYLDAWNKHLQKEPLGALEKKICEVIEMHPDYQKYISSKFVEKEFEQANPFLHLGLHLALKEQIQNNRPQGIQAVYLILIQKHKDTHQVEHAMIEVLEYILWKAQKDNSMPDEKTYLKACEELAKK